MASLVQLDGQCLDSVAVEITAAQCEAWLQDGFTNIMLNVLHGTFVTNSNNPGGAGDYATCIAAGLKVGLFQGYESSYFPGGSKAETGSQRAQSAIAAAQAVGYPAGAYIFVDIESVPSIATQSEMITWINDWIAAVGIPGFGGGVYFGPYQPVSASAAYSDLFNTTLFWKSYAQDTITPTPCGCCIIQTGDVGNWDTDRCGADNFGRYAFGAVQ